jgi:hypothetical protein
MPELEPDYAKIHLELYKNGDSQEDFGHFGDQRETNIEVLRGLPTDASSCKAKHRAAGEITLSQMLHEWALHDLGHVLQIESPDPWASAFVRSARTTLIIPQPVPTLRHALRFLPAQGRSLRG